jgi:hypothetical protein
VECNDAIYAPLNLYSAKKSLRDHLQIQIQFLTAPIRLDFLGKHILRVVPSHVEFFLILWGGLAQAKYPVSNSTP